MHVATDEPPQELDESNLQGENVLELRMENKWLKKNFLNIILVQKVSCFFFMK